MHKQEMPELTLMESPLQPIRRTSRKPTRGQLLATIAALEATVRAQTKVIKLQRDYIKQETGNNLDLDLDIAAELQKIGAL